MAPSLGQGDVTFDPIREYRELAAAVSRALDECAVKSAELALYVEFFDAHLAWETARDGHGATQEDVDRVRAAQDAIFEYRGGGQVC